MLCGEEDLVAGQVPRFEPLCACFQFFPREGQVHPARGQVLQEFSCLWVRSDLLGASYWGKVLI